MSKIVFIVAPIDFRDEELFEPLKILKNDNEITIASKGVSVARGSGGESIDVDLDIGSVDVKEFDAVIFIGGAGATIYFEDAEAIALAKAAFDQKKIIAAICIAPSILANAGVLKDKKATAFPSQERNLKSKAAFFIKGDVVTDDTIITASGPKAAKSFGEKIQSALLMRLKQVQSAL